MVAKVIGNSGLKKSGGNGISGIGDGVEGMSTGPFLPHGVVRRHQEEKCRMPLLLQLVQVPGIPCGNQIHGLGTIEPRKRSSPATMRIRPYGRGGATIDCGEGRF